MPDNGSAALVDLVVHEEISSCEPGPGGPQRDVRAGAREAGVRRHPWWCCPPECVFEAGVVHHLSRGDQVDTLDGPVTVFLQAFDESPEHTGPWDPLVVVKTSGPVNVDGSVESFLTPAQALDFALALVALAVRVTGRRSWRKLRLLRVREQVDRVRERLAGPGGDA